MNELKTFSKEPVEYSPSDPVDAIHLKLDAIEDLCEEVKGKMALHNLVIFLWIVSLVVAYVR